MAMRWTAATNWTAVTPLHNLSSDTVDNDADG
jgi:hypothetical protein